MSFDQRVRIILETVTGNAKKGIDDFKLSVASAETSTGKFGAGVKSLGTSFLSAATSPLGLAAGVGSVVAIAGKAIGSFESLGLSVGKFSDATGIGAEASSRLIEHFNDLGISTETAESAIGKMEKALGANVHAFEKYGITVVQAKDGTVDANATFIKTIGVLQGITDPTQRATAAAAIFGKGWTSLAEVIGEGSAKLQAGINGVQLSKVLSAKDVQSARDLRDGFDSIRDAGEGLFLTLGKSLAPAIVGLVKPVGEVITAVGPLVQIIGQDLAGAFKAVEPAVTGAGKVLGLFAESAKTWSGLTKGAFNAVSGAHPDSDLVKQAQEDSNAVVHLSGSIDDAAVAANSFAAAQKLMGHELAQSRDANKVAATAADTYANSTRQATAANLIGADAEAEYAKNVQAAADQAQTASDRHAAVAAAVTGEAQAAEDAAAKWAAYATAIAGIGDTTGTLDNQVSAFSTALSSSADDASATLKANLSLDDSYAKLKQSLKDNGKGVDESTAKGRANIAAILDVGSAIRDNLVRQLADAGGSYESVTASADLYRAQLSKQLTQAGLTKAQIADYIKTLGLTPEQITTDIKLTGEAQAKAALDSLNVNIDDIPDSKKTEFIADVKSGDYEAALALFEQITADKTTKIDPSVDPAARSKAEDQLKALTDPLNAKVTADANTAAAEAKLQAFADSPPGVDLTVTPDIAAARAAIQRGLNNTVVNVKLNPVKGAFASGTKSAEPGPASVAETGAEIILDEDGARLVKDPSVVMMRGGEKVYTASETAAILAGGAGTGAGMKLPGYAGGTGSPINGTGSAQQTYNLVIAPTQTAAAAASTSSGVDDAIKEQDRLQAAEYHTNRISLDQYKQYVAGRLAASADLSDDYLTQYDLLQQLADTEKQTAADRAQAAKDAADAETQAAADAIAAQDDLMKNEAALGVISQAQYKDYLAGRLGTYAQYSDGYTQIALQIKAIDDQQLSDQVKSAQDSADAQLKIYKQLQANKAVVDAEAEQDRQTAAVRDAGAAGSKVQNDRHSTADDRAQAVQALSDAQTKLADDTYKTILSKASAENLTEGSVDWDRFVSGLLRSAIDTFNQNGFTVTAAALGGDLSGIPQLAKGGIVKKRPGGHLVNVAEAGHDEAIVPLPANGQMFGGNTTNHFHLPPGWSAEHALIATNEQAARRGYRAA